MSIRTGRATLYELVVERGETRLLLMYCASRGRGTLLECARKHAAALVALTGEEGLDFMSRAGGGASMGAWRIRWTGRTQRDAQFSKLPWIGDWKQEVAA